MIMEVSKSKIWRAAGSLETQESMFQFKSKGCLPIEFLLVGEVSHCSNKIQLIKWSSYNGLALWPVMDPPPASLLSWWFSPGGLLFLPAVPHRHPRSWVPTAVRVQGHFKKFPVPFKSNNVAQHLFKAPEHLMTVSSKSPIFFHHPSLVCFVFTEEL